MSEPEPSSSTELSVLPVSPDVSLFTRRVRGSRAVRRIVLLHPAGASSASWDGRLVQLLVDHGFEVLLLDMRDSGKSSYGPRGEVRYTERDLALDTAAVLVHLGWSDVVILGMGLGAAVVTAVAQIAPGLVSLAIAVSPVQADPSSRTHAALAPQLQGLLAADAFGNPRPVTAEAFIKRRVAHAAALAGSDFDLAAALRLAEAEFFHSDDIITQLTNLPRLRPARGEPAGVVTPVLVAQGSEDPVLPLTLVSQWASELHSARMLLLAGAGHAHLPPSSWRVLVDLLQVQ